MYLGDHRIEVVPDTEFRLDGGAMFGVVPRVLWERVAPPDELNRIRMNMNCLFIDTGREKILVETGIGEKWTEKQTGMYGIFREKPFAETLFEKTGCRPQDIDIVVNTHLHFDHAGGNTVLSEPEAVATGSSDLSKPEAVATGSQDTPKAIPQFPNARYFVSKAEFEHAENPHERDRASYLKENWQPLIETGQLEFKPNDYEVADGICMETVRGHSETMQCLRIDRGGKTLYGFYDLIPMTAHLSPAWIAGFDLFPLETLEFKKKILKQAVSEDWLCLFYHETELPLCNLIDDSGKVRFCEFH